MARHQLGINLQGRRHDVKSGGAMASAVARDSKGVWGLCPQWGPGARPLVRGSGGQSPPEAGSFLHFQRLICVEYVHAVRYISELLCIIVIRIYCNFML